jgi:hypothetical protein
LVAALLRCGQGQGLAFGIPFGLNMSDTLDPAGGQQGEGQDQQGEGFSVFDQDQHGYASQNQEA